MIRIALVDDHPAVRAGLRALLSGEPGFIPVVVPFEGELTPDDVLAAEADVALVDGQLPIGTGLGLCHDLSRLDSAPSVILYSAYLGEELAIAARVAGAAGALNKSTPLEQLLDTLRTVAGGGTRFPPVSPWALRVCAGRLQSRDLPLFSMLVHGTTRVETAQTLKVTPDELHAWSGRVVTALARSLMPAAQPAHAAA